MADHGRHGLDEVADAADLRHRRCRRRPLNVNFVVSSGPSDLVDGVGRAAVDELVDLLDQAVGLVLHRQGLLLQVELLDESEKENKRRLNCYIIFSCLSMGGGVFKRFEATAELTL